MAFNSLAIPILYDDVELDVGDLGSRKIKAFINSNSKAHASVRSLAFTPTGSSDTVDPSVHLDLMKAGYESYPRTGCFASRCLSK